MSNAPIRLVLGYFGVNRQCLAAFSLRVTSASGKAYDFEPFCLPDGGETGNVDEVIPPHKEWTRDMSIKDFMGDFHGDSLINPISGDMLPAGSYRMQVFFKGTRYPSPKHALRYWTGTLESNEVDYNAPRTR